MNKALVRDFFVGLTAIIGVAGLIFMLIFFGEFRKHFEPVYMVRIAMPDATGLGGTSPVLLNGVRVGAVTRLDVADPPTDGMIATLKILRGVRLPRDLSIYIEKGFVGDSAMAVTYADGADPNAFLSETAYAPGSSTAPIRVVPHSLFTDLRKPLERFSTTADKIEKLADTYTKVGEDLRVLLRPATGGADSPDQPVTFARVLARADSTLAGMQKWLNDDELLASIKTSATKISAVVDDVKTAVQSFDQAARSINDKGERVTAAFESLSRDAAATLSRLDGALGDLGEVAAKVNRGEGTAGQLVNNPDLYRSLNSAADRLDKALRDLQLLLEKFKAEGIKVGL
jgi:phospholipid/cholesterol/gamma-HCH transport system substrate-binding protein